MRVQCSSLPGTEGSLAPVILCLLALLGLALVARTTYLAEVGLHFDECCSWKISQFPFAEMIDAVSRDAHPPIYYCMMKLAGLLGAHDVASIRGISIAWGLGAVVAAYWFVLTVFQQLAEARRPPPLASRTMHLFALLAAALVASNPMHIDLSLQARPYAFGTCLALLAATFLLRAFSVASRITDWCLFTICATVLSLTHYYGLLTVAAFFIFAMSEVLGFIVVSGWGARTRRQAVATFGSMLALQVAWLPWWETFQFQRSRSTGQLWMGPLTWKELTENCWHALAGPQPLAIAQGWEAVALLLWVLIIVCVAVTCGRAGRLVGLAAGIPLLGILLYAATVRNILGAKYLIFAQVFLLVGCALLAAKLSWPSLRLSAAAIAIALSGYAGCDYLTYREQLTTSSGIRGVSEFLERQSAPGEPVIAGSPFVSVVLQHYFSRPESVYVSYLRDHRQDLLGGPPLRDSEYQNLDQRWQAAPETVWTVDVYELFYPENVLQVSPPPDWTMVEQHEFREVSGLTCILAVRKYTRNP